MSSSISGSHDLIIAGSGSVALTGTNSAFTGNLIVYGFLYPRTSALSAANAVGVASGAIVDMNGNSGVTIAGLNDVSGSGGSVLNSGGVPRTLTLGGTGNYSFGGILTSSPMPVVVNMAAGGKQTFTGLNLYSASTTINGGTLSVTNLTNPANTPTTWTTISGANVAAVANTAGLVVGMSAMGTASGTPNTFPAGSTIIGISGTAVTLSANAVQTNSATAVTFGYANGLGLSSNAAANLTINGGALQFSGTDASKSSTDRLFTVGASGATLDASGSVPVSFTNTGAVAFAGSGARTITLLGSNTGANLLAASIGNSGTSATVVAKSGAGTWVVSGSNAYTGGTIVNAGTLKLGNDKALGATSGALTVNGGTLDLGGHSVTVGTLSGSAGSIVNTVSGTSTVTTAIATGTATFNGSIVNGAGAVALTKTGTGALVLGGALDLAGLNASAGTVNLGGSASVGDLSVGSGVTVTLATHTSSSTWNVIDARSLSFAGLGFSDAVTGDPINCNQVLLSVTGLGDLNCDGMVDGSNYGLMDSFQNPLALGDANGTSSDFSLLDNGCQTQVYGVLNVSQTSTAAGTGAAPASPEAVPEPGTLGLFGAGLSLLGLLRRRNKAGKR